MILAVLVVANFLANRYNKSYDATANKRFTLSDQTKKVVGDLKQDVTIQLFRPRQRNAGRQGLAGPLSESFAQAAHPVCRLLKNPTLARARKTSPAKAKP